jgi:hypothetical protein
MQKRYCSQNFKLPASSTPVFSVSQSQDAQGDSFFNRLPATGNNSDI